MNSQKIVFPTDFSHSSEAALEYATRMARQSGGTLYIVHAEEPPQAYGGGEMYYGFLEPTHSELMEMLAEVKPSDPQVSFEHRMLHGFTNAADQVVEFAKEIGADLIVLGSHGRTGMKRLLMGSIAEAIVRHAPCPVMIVKKDQDPRAIRRRRKTRVEPKEEQGSSKSPASRS